MRNLSLKQIRTMIELFETRKISTAAGRLGLTSPAVTIQLQQMEEEAQAQLFIRSKTGITPTPAGELVHEASQRIVSELENLELKLKSLEGLSSGSIRLGVVSTGKYFAPRIIAAFNRLYPDIQLSLVAANRSVIIEKLKNFDIDLALMGRTPNELDVRAMLFGDHPLVFIAPPDHPLAGRLDITREELLQYPFIVREAGSGTRNAFWFFIGEAGRDFARPPAEMDSNETIKQAVIAGLGLALISGHAIEQECANGKLVILDVEETPLRRNWYAVSQTARRPTPALTAFNSFLLRKGPALLPIVSKPYRASQMKNNG